VSRGNAFLQPGAVPVHGECVPFLRLRIVFLLAGMPMGSSSDRFLQSGKVIIEIHARCSGFLELRARKCSYGISP
jgi:hypothetical protein